MLKKYKLFFLSIFCIGFLASCSIKDEDFNLLNRDNIPSIPVMFPNMGSDGFDPFLRVSRGATPSSAPFQIQISIPASSGRTIREVFIRGGNTTLNAASVTGNVSLLHPGYPAKRFECYYGNLFFRPG
ncbi:MAG: hypothetical protein HC880_03985 [Bacteroidia bacterium]|nr:hypothetical protein [Bacteroidia bacterium]